jgi:hypothetical protein
MQDTHNPEFAEKVYSKDMLSSIYNNQITQEKLIKSLNSHLDTLVISLILCGRFSGELTRNVNCFKIWWNSPTFSFYVCEKVW